MWYGTAWFGKLLRRMTKQGSKYPQRLWRTGRLWLAGSFVCLLPTLAVAQTSAGIIDPADLPALNRCGTVEYERILQQRNPDRLRQLNELNRQVEQALKSRAGALIRGGRAVADDRIFRIPIVVHVVHNNANGDVGGPTNGNISDEQIQSQIQVLNEDYRRQPGTNGFNTSPIGADARIEFFLATKDPKGNPTNGITRNYYPQKTDFGVDDNSGDDILLSQISYWPSDRYLNIWVTKVKTYLGYTQFPTAADTLSALPIDSNEFIDGSIIDYRYFGRQIGTIRDPTYALGRTATHEIGHWLGLLHTWGDGAGCAEDYVADTPPTKAPNQTRQCRETYSNCDGKGQTRDQTENFLDYSPDICMNLFTQGQVARMRTVLALSPRRARLIRASESPLTESEMLAILVYPNPSTTESAVEVRLKGFQTFTVDLFDIAGRQLGSQTYTDSPSAIVSVPVAGLSRGMYVVRVRTSNETVSRRLLIQ